MLIVIWASRFSAGSLGADGLAKRLKIDHSLSNSYYDMAYAQQNPIKITVVGLHGKKLGVYPWSNFLRFHAVFGTFWPNDWLTPPFRVGALPSEKSWICRWIMSQKVEFCANWFGKLRHWTTVSQPVTTETCVSHSHGNPRPPLAKTIIA